MSLYYGDGRYVKNPVQPGPVFTSAPPEKVKDPGLLNQGPRVWKDNSPVFNRKIRASEFPFGYGLPTLYPGPYSGSDDRGWYTTSITNPFWGGIAGRPAKVGQRVICSPIFVSRDGQLEPYLRHVCTCTSEYNGSAYNVVNYEYLAVVTNAKGRNVVWASISLATSTTAYSGWRTRIRSSTTPLDYSRTLVGKLYASDPGYWFEYHSGDETTFGFKTSQTVTILQAVEAIQRYYTGSFSTKTYANSYVTVSDYSAEKKLSKIQSLIPAPHPFQFDINVPGDVRWDASTEAAIGARYLNINTGRYLSELPKIAATIRTIKDVRKGSPKAIADAYLSMYYGLRLTAADTHEIASVARREISKIQRSSNRIQARKTFRNDANVDVIYNITIDYEPYDQSAIKLLNTLMSVDLFPSLKNVWDLIPFSFVLDWFVNIQDVLEEIDANTFWSTNRIHCVQESTKLDRVVQLQGTSENVLLSDYTRDVNFELPPCRPKVDDPTLPSLRNWVNGFFLILQRR